MIPDALHQEAVKVRTNLKGDNRQIAHYLIERCGDFLFDSEREDLIVAFLDAALATLQGEELTPPDTSNPAIVNCHCGRCHCGYQDGQPVYTLACCVAEHRQGAVKQWQRMAIEQQETILELLKEKEARTLQGESAEPPKEDRNESSISAQDAVRNEPHERFTGSRGPHQPVGEGERRQCGTQDNRTDPTGSASPSKEIVEARVPHEPPADIVQFAIEASTSSPCRSKRGVVVFRGADLVSQGYNYKPRGFDCDGSDACKATCRDEAVHAEQQALLLVGRKAEGCDLLHVKTVGGMLVPSGPPSCVQCSKLALAAGILGVWLFRGEDGWVRYPMAEFHRLSLEAQASRPAPPACETGSANYQRLILEIESWKTEVARLMDRVDILKAQLRSTTQASRPAPPLDWQPLIDLSTRWGQEADEIDQDGDFCCAQTRRDDAGELFDLIRKLRADPPAAVPQAGKE